MTMQSAFGQVARKGGRRAAPESYPSPGTLEPCHMRAWFSMATTPRPRMSLLQVIPFVIHGGTTQREDVQRVMHHLAPGIVLHERLVAGRAHRWAIRSMALSSGQISHWEAPGCGGARALPGWG